MVLCYKSDSLGCVIMNKNNKNILTRSALLFALAVVFQGLRLVIPIAPPMSMFLIGTLVNMTLILSVRYVGLSLTIVMGCLLPVIAFMQGQLAIILLIPLVAIGNVIMVVLAYYLWQRKIFLWIIPVAKMLVLYMGAVSIIKVLGLPEQISRMVLFVMSWPQLITASIGLVLAIYMEKKIPFNKN